MHSLEEPTCHADRDICRRLIQTNNCPISPNTLGAGASCTLTVTFTPSTLGGTKETAKIVINDNANNSPQTVFLKGAGQ